MKVQIEIENTNSGGGYRRTPKLQNGRIHGRNEVFFEEGKKESELEFVLGVPHGSGMWWNYSGEILEKKTYKQNDGHGIQLIFEY